MGSGKKLTWRCCADLGWVKPRRMQVRAAQRAVGLVLRVTALLARGFWRSPPRASGIGELPQGPRVRTAGNPGLLLVGGAADIPAPEPVLGAH